MPPIHQFYPVRCSSVLPCSNSSALCIEHGPDKSQLQSAGTRRKTTSRSRIFKIGNFGNTSRNEQCHLISLLPLEILQEMAEYLLRSDRIAFTLTCKALYSALGTSAFPSPKDDKESGTMDFLMNLYRDIPAHRICRPCQKLHHPSRSIIRLPRNKLRRQSDPHSFPPALKFYLLAPGAGPDREILYWLGDEHVRLAVSKQICISTLRCSGTIKLSTTLGIEVPALHETTFSYNIKPVCSRGDMIMEATYEIQFPITPKRHWSESYVRSLLRHFDIRCCIHCTNNAADAMLDEMVCFLLHDRLHPSCQRVRAIPYGHGCGHHFHDCGCLTEYKIEAKRERVGDPPSTVSVQVWQWLGKRKDDVVLRKRGVLRMAYEDAVWDDMGSAGMAS